MSTQMASPRIVARNGDEQVAVSERFTLEVKIMSRCCCDDARNSRHTESARLFLVRRAPPKKSEEIQ